LDAVSAVLPPIPEKPAARELASVAATQGLPLGARVVGGRTRFAAYVTTSQRCHVRLFEVDGKPDRTVELEALGGGYFAAEVPGAGQGTLYKLVIDGKELPDPYARWLPLGVHGPAMVVEPHLAWRHGEGVYRPLREHVLYELHVGTFTEEGTYAAARTRLRDLALLGVTAIELMPVAAFAGTRGWGYDGVAQFAPFAPYGVPDELRRLVDEAHGLGLSVFLDVVYNHFGPAGNYLRAFAPEYFSASLKNAWGDAPDFTHPAMRRYLLDSALAWLTEYRFDGLRLDAIHALVDPSPRHILRELADKVARLSPPKLLIAEDERNDPGGVGELGMHALWADDFHHQVRVTLTGERDGYYQAYEPGAAGIAAALQHGWLYRGQSYPPTGQPRGHDAGELPAEAFVYCLENHDQIGNRAFGDRLSEVVSIEATCAASCLLLFLPMTPLLFMGQEWAASSPFLYFTDHEAELGRLIAEGRRAEFKSFRAFLDPATRDSIPDPQAPSTFLRSRLRWDERDFGHHARVLQLHRDLLALRRQDEVLRASAGRADLEATAHGDVLVVRRRSAGGERLLLANLGASEAAVPSACNAGARPVLLASDGSRPLGAVLGSYRAVILGDAR
jgi:maltooligosyltrehalose trehalohydrolase